MNRFIIFALFLSAPTVALAQGTEQFTYARVVGILFRLVDFALAVGLTLAVIMIIWNAIQIMTGRSIITPEKGDSYSQAKKNIWYALIGVAIILGVNVILATIQSVVTSGQL